jgi:hypothetical protein
MCKRSRLAEDALDGLQVPLAVAPHQHHEVPRLVDAAAAGDLLLYHLQYHLPIGRPLGFEPALSWVGHWHHGSECMQTVM